MKKTLVVLLTVAIVIGLFSVAFAYDGEITFQGIPWEENNDIVSKKLGCSNSNLQQGTGDCLLMWEGRNPTFRSGGSTWPGYDNYDQWIYSQRGASMPIAGYTVNKLVLSYFVNNTEDPKFICASFSVDAPNQEEAYEDLKTKLTSVYGNGEDLSSNYYKLAYWLGANDTAILIDYDIEGDMVMVYYGTLKAEQYFKEAFEEQPKEEEHNNVTNTTTGL